jgi:hypothetical protein
MPERVYNLSYAPATQTLLVSMSHRHVYVYSLRELSAAGEDLKPQSSRESALKFLTRSVACMADGKGRSFVSLLIGTGEEVEVSESVLIDRMGVWVHRQRVKVRNTLSERIDKLSTVLIKYIPSTHLPTTQCKSLSPPFAFLLHFESLLRMCRTDP